MLKKASVCEYAAISDTQVDEIEAMPMLTAQLPFKFRNGGAISTITISCGSCGDSLEPKVIRGQFKTICDGEAATLTAYGICYKCRKITPLEAKFHSDGMLIYKIQDRWAKDRWGEVSKNGLWKILRKRKDQLIPPLIAVAVIVAWYVCT